MERAPVASVDEERVSDERRAVVRARVGRLPLDLGLLPLAVLGVEDVNVVETLAPIQPSEDEDPAVRKLNNKHARVSKWGLTKRDRCFERPSWQVLMKGWDTSGRLPRGDDAENLRYLPAWRCDELVGLVAPLPLQNLLPT